MESFTSHTGLAVPLMRANIDTDQIIPTRFLARMSEEGLGQGLFAEWATRPDGSADASFILNREPWTGASILLAGPMFGCGSSREAAPRALRQRGFRAVIAPSFGDIFFGNCFRSGIVPVRLPQAVVEELAQGAALATRESPAAGLLRVSLETRIVECVATGSRHPFHVPALLGRMLLEGLDEIALTRTLQRRIDDFRSQDHSQRPWAYL
jgi:3-isopropylmalate/(R)-2-methylmalate dehydratase small subunit